LTDRPAQTSVGAGHELGERERELMARVAATNYLQSWLHGLPGPLVRAAAAGIVWFFVTLISDLLAGSWFRVLESEGARLGLLDDYVGQLQEFVIFPLLVAFFFWTPMALMRALADLDSAGIVQVTEEDLRWLEHELGRPSVRVGLVLLAILFAGVIYLTYVGSPLGQYLWLGNPGFALVKFPFWVIHTYVAAYLIAWVLVTIALLGRLFSTERIVNIEALHPDDCGGLRPLSAYVLALVWFIGLSGATLVLVERNYFLAHDLGTSPFAFSIHLVVGAYLLASVGAFFGPLIAPHQRMAAEKRRALSEISTRFRMVEDETMAALGRGSSAEVQEVAQRLDAMRKIYRVVYEFPVWPFDPRVLRRFALAALGQPVLALLLDLAKDRVVVLLR